jgi:hypothetical protein
MKQTFSQAVRLAALSLSLYRKCCGFKAAKDHFMLLLGSNASKDPLMVFQTENSWPLQAYIKT